MEILALLEIWRLLTWLPKWILKRIFSEQRMADLVIVDIRPRHERVTVNLNPTPTYELWFQAINISPFEVELDRVHIEFICAGTSLNMSYTQKTKFESGKISEFHVTGDIPEGKANAIARHLDRDYSSISMDMDFNCLLHSFSKQCRNLQGITPRFINHNLRANKT